MSQSFPPHHLRSTKTARPAVSTCTTIIELFPPQYLRSTRTARPAISTSPTMSLLIPPPAMESPTPAATNRTQLPLPPEIRTMIYRYVFTSTTPFVRGSDTKSQRCRHHPSFIPDSFVSYPCANIHSAIDLSLLLVSRDTYIETFHMYYALNTVHLCSTRRMYHFLTRIGYARRQQLVSLGFHNFDNDAKSAFHILRTAKRLEHLKFHLPGNSSRQQTYLNVPGMAALREVRGLSHVEITSPYDCSDLIAAMMRPRLVRYTSNSIDNKEVDLFKQPRERFPKTEVQRLTVGMNWTFGTKLCSSCTKLATSSSKPAENKPLVIPPPRIPDLNCVSNCGCWRYLGQGLHV